MPSYCDAQTFNQLSLSCSQSRLQLELKKVPKLQKFWNLIKKKLDKMDADAAEQ